MTAVLASYGLLAALAIALLVAALSDLRRREIDNGLTGAVALMAVPWWWASGVSIWPDAALQVGVALLAFALLAALFAAGAVGGGDVKLLAALALWLPWRSYLLLILGTAVLGGLLTLACVARHWRTRREAIEVPYGVAIAAAGWWVLATAALPPGVPAR